MPPKPIDEALKKLDIGYIDMMLLHLPVLNDVTAYKAIEKAVRTKKYGLPVYPATIFGRRIPSYPRYP